MIDWLKTLIDKPSLDTNTCQNHYGVFREKHGTFLMPVDVSDEDPLPSSDVSF